MNRPTAEQAARAEAYLAAHATSLHELAMACLLEMGPGHSLDDLVGIVADGDGEVSIAVMDRSTTEEMGPLLEVPAFVEILKQRSGALWLHVCIITETFDACGRLHMYPGLSRGGDC